MDMHFVVKSCASLVVLYFYHTNLTSNPSLGSHDGFSKRLLGF